MTSVEEGRLTGSEAPAIAIRPVGKPRGALAWFMQRLTAVLVLVFLGAHLWVLHFATIGKQVSFTNVSARLHSPWFVVIDGLLLATTVYHALNGTRTVIFDFNVGSAAKRWITFLLWAFGIVATVYGINALLPFMGYSPFFGG